MSDAQVGIIGAGPIGIELAVVLQRAGVSAVQFDAGTVGQTITWYPRQVRFFSSPERIAIAGVPLHTADQSKATREEYLTYLRSVVEQFDLPIHTHERVTDIARDGGGYMLTTQRGDGTHRYRFDKVIIAIGDMHRPRTLGIPGEELPHVSHYFVEPDAYFRKRLVIVGGRNSAVEAALRCYRIGAHVTISYRRDTFDRDSVKYWLWPDVEYLIDKGRIAYHPRTTPTAITPTHITLAHTDTGRTSALPADFVLLLTGYEMDASLFERAGVELVGENRAPVFDESTMQTNVPGLYVAGTATAGTQNRFKAFIETSHVHVDRIVAHLTGQRVQPARPEHESMPES